ncbi:TPA: hypothetical protein ACTYZ0_003569 [Citrobacter werkmanii]
MKTPIRRMIWIAAAVAGAVSLVSAKSTIDEQNVLHDSALLPLGWILLLLAFAFLVFDAIKTLTRR